MVWCGASCCRTGVLYSPPLHPSLLFLPRSLQSAAAEAMVAELAAENERLAAEVAALRGHNARLQAEAAEAELALTDARVSREGASVHVGAWLATGRPLARHAPPSLQSKYAGLEKSTGKLMDHHFQYKQGIEAALAAMGASFEALKEAAE